MENISVNGRLYPEKEAFGINEDLNIDFLDDNEGDEDSEVVADDEDEDGKDEAENKLKTIEELLIQKADYGFLPKNHPISLFFQKMCRKLLPDIPEEEYPNIEILATRGEGINASVFENWTIVINPELVEFAETEEELEYVFLHEVGHLVNKDHKNSRKKIRESFRKFIGHARAAEYSADIYAFRKMSEAATHSNPLGAIQFLERFRKIEEGKNWGLVHGRTTDRIIILKGLSGLLELDSSKQNESIHKLTEDLTPLSVDMREASGKLKQGGFIQKLLDKPPSDGDSYDKWRSQIFRILEKADLNFIESVAPYLYETIIKNQGRITRELASTKEYKAIFVRVLRRWNELVEKEYSSFSREDLCKIKLWL